MLRRILIGIIAAALAILPTQAQSPLKAFPPGVFQNRAAIDGGSTPTPFSITNTASPVDTTAQTTYTFTSASIGSADASRVVAVFEGARNGGVVSNATGVTIGGSAATLVQAGINTGSGTVTCNIWQLAVPSGTTSTIAVTYPSSMLRAGISVYSVLGSNGTAPSGAAIGTNNNGTANTATITVPSGGGSIVGITNISSASIAPTNYTEDVDKVIGSTMFYETGHDTSHSGSTVYTGTLTPSGIACGSYAAWSP